MFELLTESLATFTRKISSVVTWPRRKKRIVLSIMDGVVLFGLLWLLISSRYSEIYIPAEFSTFLLMLLAPVLIVSALLLRNAYHEVTRFIGLRGGLKLTGTIVFAALVWATIVLMSGQQGIPRSVIMIFVFVAPLILMLLRNFAASLLRWTGVHVPNRSQAQQRMPVAIYGAGRLGAELGYAFAGNKTRQLVAFFDDSPGVIGRKIDGVRVFDPKRLTEMVDKLSIRELILAQGGASQPGERLKLLKSLEAHNVRLRILPELDAIASGRVNLSHLRPVQGRELLGREAVPGDPELLSHSVTGKVVLVTGAGGSIGAEIIRQCYALQPRHLVLVENSEFALFKIEQELIKLNRAAVQDKRITYKSYLASILEDGAMADIMTLHKVETVFHAAAFKHVPIVEANILSGVDNNTIGTHVVAEAAIHAGVERFVLISTDKAVKPTSVLGASKRFAELIVRAHALRSEKTKFCSVRFGNVLGSSGSVFELFIEQIQAGGPITVTHPEVVRYFMSLEEAAGLVIQAASMAERGEVYLLDMGDPVQIVDMARALIGLLGYTEKTEQDPNGEIEIKFTALRPGEKLIEELLTKPELAAPTQHPKIKRSNDPTPSEHLVWVELENIQRAIEHRDAAFVIASLKALVTNYEESQDIHNAIKPSETRTLN